MSIILKGKILRETLYGCVRVGEFRHGKNGEHRSIPIIIKEYTMKLVQCHQTRDGQNVYEDAIRELRLHQMISLDGGHPNIIKLYDVVVDETRMHAVLEYAAYGELFTLIKEDIFDSSNTSHYFRQLMSAVAYIHSKDIAHRDISLENILVDSLGNVKLCDFGLAIQISNTRPYINDGYRVGKLRYMSAEVYAGEEYDPRLADIWSCGVVLFIMLTGVFPWDVPSSIDVRCVQGCCGIASLQAMVQNWELPALNNDAADLLARIFCAPKDRISAEDVLAHQYLQFPASLQSDTILDTQRWLTPLNSNDELCMSKPSSLPDDQSWIDIDVKSSKLADFRLSSNSLPSLSLMSSVFSIEQLKLESNQNCSTRTTA